MKMVLRTKNPDDMSYKYILDDNYITVKRFENRTEAFAFLKENYPNFKISDWECITFKKFEEELKICKILV